MSSKKLAKKNAAASVARRIALISLRSIFSFCRFTLFLLRPPDPRLTFRPVPSLRVLSSLFCMVIPFAKYYVNFLLRS